jgi:hypothetical protein
LSQYGKHFDNIKLEGLPKKPPKPSHDEQKEETKKEEKKKEEPKKEEKKTPLNVTLPPIPDDDGEMESFADSSDMTVLPTTSTPTSKALALPHRRGTPISPVLHEIQKQTKTPKEIKLHTPRTEILKMLQLQASDTPRKVISLLMKKDSSFQYNKDNETLIIHGHSISKKHFLDLLEHLRNPNYQPLPGHDEYIFSKLSETVQDESEKTQKTLLTQLPGLKKYITSKPSGTRAASSTARRKIEIDDTALTTTAPQLPKKIGSQIKGKGTRRKACTVVHWNRWQNHLTK